MARLSTVAKLSTTIANLSMMVQLSRSHGLPPFCKDLSCVRWPVADCPAIFSRFLMSEMTRVTDCMGEAATVSHRLPTVLRSLVMGEMTFFFGRGIISVGVASVFLA